jgi:hypothetical protein
VTIETNKDMTTWPAVRGGGTVVTTEALQISIERDR